MNRTINPYSNNACNHICNEQNKSTRQLNEITFRNDESRKVFFFKELPLIAEQQRYSFSLFFKCFDKKMLHIYILKQKSITFKIYMAIRVFLRDLENWQTVDRHTKFLKKFQVCWNVLKTTKKQGKSHSAYTIFLNNNVNAREVNSCFCFVKSCRPTVSRTATNVCFINRHCGTVVNRVDAASFFFLSVSQQIFLVYYCYCYYFYS